MQQCAKIGQQTVAFGASGVDPGSGSAAQVKRGMDYTGMINAQTLSSKYGMAAAQQRAQQYSYAAQAGLDQYEANTLPLIGGIQAGGTLLSGIGKFGFA